MTTIPITFITKSVGLVFAQQATDEFNLKNNCKDSFLKTFKLLTILLAPPFIILLLFGPNIFEFIFGVNWRVAGEYVQILSIMFYLRAITSPLTYIFIIVNKQNEDFWLHILTLILISACLYLSSIYLKNVKGTLVFYSISYSCIYLYYLYRAYTLSTKKLN